MKIKVINPNTSEEMTKDIYHSACAAKKADTVIVCTNPEHGPGCVEGASDAVVSTYYLLEEIKKSEKEGGYDAYIIACFGDPGVDAIREITDKPVIGIAEAAFHMSAFLGAKFSVVSTLPRMRMDMEERIRRHGAEVRLASIRTPNLPVLAFHEDLAGAKKTLINAAKEAVENDLAEVIILGCAGMSGFADEVSQAVGVPVIDTVTTAVKVAESLVDMKLKTSKSNTYQKPTPKIFK